MRIIEIERFELLVQILDLLAIYAMRHLCVEPIARADDCDVCIGVEQIQNTAGGYLCWLLTSTFPFVPKQCMVSLPRRHPLRELSCS